MGRQVLVPPQLADLLDGKVVPVIGERTGLRRGESKCGDGVGRQPLGVPVQVLVVGTEMVDNPHSEHEVLLSGPCSVPPTVALQALVGLQ